MKFFSKAILGAACSALFAIGAAQAATVSSQLYGGVNQLSDNSAESLIDMNVGAQSVAGRVDIGDRLRGIFTIETVEPLGGGSTRNLGGGSGNNELSGLFDITVVGKLDLGAAAGAGRYQYVFAPTASFAAEIGGPAGTMVAFYEDTNAEYSRLAPTCTTTGFGGDCEANIKDGSLLWALGVNGGGDEFWTASAFTDIIGLIGAASSSTAGGFFNVGLDLLLNNSTREFLGVDCGFPAAPTSLEFCGSGSLLGRSGAATPYDSFDNVDFTINLVPEPSTIALAGLALLGVAAASRRRKV